MNYLKVIDFLSGKNVSSYWKVYKKTQWFSKNEMNSFQIEKLRLLLTHCYTNVPYYRRIMISKMIDPENINSLDILNEFPIITKEIIKANYIDFIPTNLNKISNVKYSQTSGTTGGVLKKRTDANTRSSVWASFKRFQTWMSYKDNPRILILMGNSMKNETFYKNVKNKIIDYLTNSISINIFDKSDENIKKIIKVLGNNKFDILRGYSQGIFILAKLFEEKDLKYNIPCVTTTAEPLLLEHRKIFKKIFNADTFDQYGCGEIGGIAYECNHHKGLHVTEERVIIRFINDIDLLITDLDNLSMPYINYYNADQAILSDSDCSCGRKSMVLKKILGRSCDYLSCLDGGKIHWGIIYQILWDSNIAIDKDVRKFQVIQKSSYDFYFKTVSNGLSLEDKQYIEKQMRNELGDEINIMFESLNEIENSSSGKYRPVINRTL